MRLHDEIRSALDDSPGADPATTLAEVVGRMRVYFAADRSGDNELATYEMNYLRSAVDAVAKPVRQHPLSTRACVILAALAAIGLSASVTAVAMRLRAQDAEVQLHACLIH